MQKVDNYFDDIAEAYSSEQDPDYKYIFESNLNSVLKFVNKKSLVLEVGCANGVYTKHLGGNKVVGLDLSLGMLQVASKRNPKISFTNASAFNLPFKDNSLDIVYSFATLPVLKNKHIFLKEASRVLKPKGVLILDVGNKYSVEAIVWKIKQSKELSLYYDSPRFSKSLKRYGLKVIKVGYFQLVKPLFYIPFQRFWSPGKIFNKLLLRKRFNGKTIDEHLSSMPIIKNLAFRQLIIAVKR